MRYFIATPTPIPLYGVIKNELSSFIEGNWSLGANLHLTHLFIGDAKEEDLKFRLQIPNEKIVIKGFEFFGDKILFLKATSPNIDSINKQLKELLPHLPRRDFKPHITLCRIKKIKDKDRLLEAIKKWEDKEFSCDFEVFLYNSTLTPKGPIYKKIFKY